MTAHQQNLAPGKEGNKLEEEKNLQRSTPVGTGDSAGTFPQHHFLPPCLVLRSGSIKILNDGSPFVSI